MTLRKFIILLLAGFALWGGWQATSAAPAVTVATTITVTTTNDEANSDGDCSLREAILSANFDNVVDACPAGNGADTIILPAGTYVLTMAVTGDDVGFSGDLDIIDDLTIQGDAADSTIIDGNGIENVFHIPDSPGAAATITGVTIRDGDFGIYIDNYNALSLSDSRVTSNVNSGIYAVRSDVTLFNSRVDYNGGGINTRFGETTLINSLVDHNTGVINGGGLDTDDASLILINSTISDNSALIDGGGISLDSNSSAQLYNSTIVNNTADSNGDGGGGGGGVSNPSGGSLIVRNSIIANNIDGGGSAHDCDDELTSEGHNLIEDPSGCTITGTPVGDIYFEDPELSLLRDNGGPTLTHALLPGSPAIDGGNPLACTDQDLNVLTTDQRGEARPLDGDGNGSVRCDIGAYEYAPPPSPTPVPANYSFTVNQTGDLSDMNPGDEICDVAVNAGAQCNLRAAIEELNALGPGLLPHNIHFNITGAGPFTLAPTTALPAITVPVKIDGATQPDTFCPTGSGPANLMIVLDGSSAGANADGLVFSNGSEGSTVSGLVIGNFDNGIQFLSDENNLYCSYVGVGPDGVSPLGNQVGVQIQGDGNDVGGLVIPDQHNVISGNDQGIQILSTGSSNSIAGNFIGTTAVGLNALGNETGLLVTGSNNSIPGNVISGNVDGIIIEGNYNLVRQNVIGLAADEATSLPNTGHGVLLDNGAQANELGGAANLANRIAFNGGDGIRLEGAAGNRNKIRGNAIYANDGLAIDLDGDGVTSNDPGDTDSGANERQNYPVLNYTPGNIRVEANLDSHPSSVFTIDVYRSQSCDPSGFGEGQQHLDSGLMTTDSTGQVFFEFDLAGLVSPGNGVTATATDPDGNTSEFSNCVTVNPIFTSLLTVNREGDGSDRNPGDGLCDASVNAGEQCSLRAAIEELNAQGAGSSLHRIEFDLSGSGPITITPGSALPVITVPMEIDGTTQTGASCPSGNAPATLMIVLDGSAAGAGASGLALGPGSEGSAIRGLAIGNFDANGLVLNSDENKVRCNHLGLGTDGISAMGNGRAGVLIMGNNNTIGGAHFASQRNVIADNDEFGLVINSQADRNLIANNFIGTTADGLTAVGDQNGGLYVAGDDNQIGITEAAANVISGNDGNGITLDQANDNIIMGNIIGMARDRLTVLPNTGNGVAIRGDASDNRIGRGDLPVQAADSIYSNLIAHNGRDGIVLTEANGAYPRQNGISQNAIFNNAGLGIDLGNDGPDVNDAGDGDTGENEKQNYPQLASASNSPVISVTLESQSNTMYTIELFRNLTCDATGHGEGQQYLRTAQVTTDGAGQAAFTVNLIGFVAPGNGITAVATDSVGNSSEFSNCLTFIPEAAEKKVFLPLIMH